jgi:hypothetical protein
MAFQIEQKKTFWIFMLSKKGCQQHYQNIVKLPQKLSLHWCVFHYLGIHDAFLLVYFIFIDDLKPDFKVFGNVFIFFSYNFLIKSDLTSTLSSSLHVYYTFFGKIFVLIGWFDVPILFSGFCIGPANSVRAYYWPLSTFKVRNTVFFVEFFCFDW